MPVQASRTRSVLGPGGDHFGQYVVVGAPVSAQHLSAALHARKHITGSGVPVHTWGLALQRCLASNPPAFGFKESYAAGCHLQLLAAIHSWLFIKAAALKSWLAGMQLASASGDDVGNCLT